jgi:hypothetical protein
MAATLKGQLLVASPTILDPNFRRTVVFMTEHGDEGAMGLVLNRAAETTVGEAVPDLAWLAGDEIVHVGGPVAPQSVVVLAEFEEPEQSALLVDDDLGFVPAEVEDTDALAGGLRRRRGVRRPRRLGPRSARGRDGRGVLDRRARRPGGRLHRRSRGAVVARAAPQGARVRPALDDAGRPLGQLSAPRRRAS